MEEYEKAESAPNQTSNFVLFAECQGYERKSMIELSDRCSYHLELDIEKCILNRLKLIQKTSIRIRIIS